MTMDEQLKLAESGHIPMLDDQGRVIGWCSPVRYFTGEELKEWINGPESE
jgi:hypothetical protein